MVLLLLLILLCHISSQKMSSMFVLLVSASAISCWKDAGFTCMSSRCFQWWRCCLRCSDDQQLAGLHLGPSTSQTLFYLLLVFPGNWAMLAEGWRQSPTGWSLLKEVLSTSALLAPPWNWENICPNHPPFSTQCSASRLSQHRLRRTCTQFQGESEQEQDAVLCIILFFFLMWLIKSSFNLLPTCHIW